MLFSIGYLLIINYLDDFELINKWNAKFIGHLYKHFKYFWNDYELTETFLAAS